MKLGTSLALALILVINDIKNTQQNVIITTYKYEMWKHLQHLLLEQYPDVDEIK